MKNSVKLLILPAMALAASPAALAAEGEPWYFNTTHWTFLSLVVFLLIITFLGAFKAIGKMLDNRSDEIQRELDYAKQLREEASGLLKEAERKQQEASEQADAIVAQAESDAKALFVKAEKDLASMVERREAQVEARISRAEDDALQAVKQIAADAATKAAADIARAEADKTNGSSAFSSALGQIKSSL
ncbi:MAG: F0F1 ATP synthase subunit B [Ponticaulis sp.]|nr:F0F1 ATP synthase subunit B [Ponticaulis sp.]|tara:strand:+ start:28612 stop:29178 length:567 start_codon:yes stop_codon:yes gene_type:complete